LSGEEYGIPILQVQEIIRYEKLTHIPQSSEFIEGVLNLRGKVIPVVDLRRRFGLQESDNDNTTRIIVVELADRTTGLIVDAVSEVRNLDKDQINPPPSHRSGNRHAVHLRNRKIRGSINHPARPQSSFQCRRTGNIG